MFPRRGIRRIQSGPTTFQQGDDGDDDGDGDDDDGDDDDDVGDILMGIMINDI